MYAFDIMTLQHHTIKNNKTVEIVGHFKYLGLTIDNKLNFDHHKVDIQKKSNQRLSAICKLKGLYIAPHLLYIV